MTNPDSAMAAARALQGQTFSGTMEEIESKVAAIIRKHQAQELTGLQAENTSLTKAVDKLSGRLSEQAQEVGELVEAVIKYSSIMEEAQKLIHAGQYHGWKDFNLCPEPQCKMVRMFAGEAESLLSRYPKV